jgi:hypothetical protein
MRCSISILYENSAARMFSVSLRGEKIPYQCNKGYVYKKNIKQCCFQQKKKKDQNPIVVYHTHPFHSSEIFLQKIHIKLGRIWYLIWPFLEDRTLSHLSSHLSRTLLQIWSRPSCYDCACRLSY